MILFLKSLVYSTFYRNIFIDIFYRNIFINLFSDLLWILGVVRCCYLRTPPPVFLRVKVTMVSYYKFNKVKVVILLMIRTLLYFFILGKCPFFYYFLGTPSCL